MPFCFMGLLGSGMGTPYNASLFIANPRYDCMDHMIFSWFYFAASDGDEKRGGFNREFAVKLTAPREPAGSSHSLILPQDARP